LADYANRTQVQKARRTELSVTAGVTVVASRSFVEEQLKFTCRNSTNKPMICVMWLWI